MKAKRLFLVLLSAVLVFGASVAYAETVGNPSFEVESCAPYPTPCAPQIGSGGFSFSPSVIEEGSSVRLSVDADDVSGVASAKLTIVSSAGDKVAEVSLFDDGAHLDGQSGDTIFSGTWNTGTAARGIYEVNITLTDKIGNSITYEGGHTVPIGEGLCASDTECTEPGLPQCCTEDSICRAADACVSQINCTAQPVNDYIGSCNTVSCPNVCQYTARSCSLTVSDGYCPSACTPATDLNCTESVPPTITITAPSGSEPVAITTANTDIVAQAYDASGLALNSAPPAEGVEFLLDGMLMFTESAPLGDDTAAPGATATWIHDWSTVSNGSHTITVRVQDTQGNLGSDTLAVNVNITPTGPPYNVNITAPASGSTFASTAAIQFQVHAEDDIGVTSVELFSTSGGGAFATAAASGQNINATLSVAASSIAKVESAVRSYAMEGPGFKLPFVQTAQAAELAAITCPPGEVESCTTTTSTAAKDVYAVAYDATDSTSSGLVRVNITTTSTNCRCVVITPRSSSSS